MLIGREKEMATIESAIKDSVSHFIAVYGRRRVGKTFLIRNAGGDRFTFQHAGVSDGGLKEQLDAFVSAASIFGYTYDKAPDNWIQAFDGLKHLILKSNETRKVVFLDELFWMDTPKSGFVSALENFWNSFVSARNDVVLIVCASATSTWKGLAFERVCLMHTDQIKMKLKIDGILTEIHSWYCKADPDHGVFGSQIDLLIVRKDQIINLCEIKYSGQEYALTEKVDRDLKRKIHDLKEKTGTKYAIYPTLVTTYGLMENSYAANVQTVVTMNDLYE